MIAFVIRRLIISVCVFLVATFILYLLTASSGNPLADLYGITNAADRANRIAARTALLDLNDPIPLRWLHWLGGVLGFLVPGVKGTFGVNVLGQDVGPLLSQAVGATLRLVVVATVVAVVTGVLVGTLSALRQYTGFDYTITFASFVFYALPIFWAAILLKQFGAIQLNTWLGDPVISWPWIIGLALLSGLLWMALLGGSTRRRMLVLAVAGFGTAGLLLFLSADRWFADPSLGPVTVPALGHGRRRGGDRPSSPGFGRRRVLQAGLAGAGVGIVVYFVTLLTRGLPEPHLAAADRGVPAHPGGGRRRGRADGRHRPLPGGAHRRRLRRRGLRPGLRGLGAGVLRGPTAARSTAGPSPPSAPTPRTSRATCG